MWFILLQGTGTYINQRVKAYDAEEDNSESDDDEFRRDTPAARECIFIFSQLPASTL